MTEIEKGAFLKLFNRGGYVLDFSTGDFDIFTKASVGVPLCQKYELSKGKSLTAFCEEASPEDVVKLFSDLLEHYEINCRDPYGEDKNTALYEKCRGIIDREKRNVQIETPAIVTVNREYIVGISSRAIRDVDNGDYDSAIQKPAHCLKRYFAMLLNKKASSLLKAGTLVNYLIRLNYYIICIKIKT